MIHHWILSKIVGFPIFQHSNKPHIIWILYNKNRIIGILLEYIRVLSIIVDRNHIIQHYCTQYFPDKKRPFRQERGPATAHGEAMPLHDGNVPAPDAPAKQPAEAAKVVVIHKLCPLLPSGKLTKNYGKSRCLMGKSTINGDFQ